jgi:hypothetical protein
VVEISYLYTISQTSKTPENMFTFRTYGKAELALLYLPCSSPDSAVKTLNRWINGCPQLQDELRSMHYHPRRHTFLKAEVEAIVRHLGEP